MVLLACVCLHRLRGLCALTAEAQTELTDALNVSAVLTSQDDVFQCLPDCVHDSDLLSVLCDSRLRLFDVESQYCS
jgi:hypothetical protein